MPNLDPFSSATTQLAALRNGDISASELLELYLERIARYNPQINAIVIPNEEQARRQAAVADAELVRGKWHGTLQGLSLTIKDCVEVAGMRATMGVLAMEHYVSEKSGPASQAILDAGAVVLGKTNVPPYVSDWQADNPVFGRTNNPWNLALTPGGSTGGGSAALAAGLTALELGTDIGGSIRVPAAFCGLYGHRPSETAVPRYGRKPGIPLPNPATVLGVQGPLARSAADIQLAMDVISGPVVGEDTAWRLEMPAARHGRLSGYRVAVLPYADWLSVDDEIVAALDDLVSHLRQQGATVEEAQPDGFELRKYTEIYSEMLHVFLYSDRSEEERAKMVEELRESPNIFAGAEIAGLKANARRLVALHTRREQYREMFRGFFRQWDILLSPVTMVTAFEHQGYKTPVYKRTLKVNEEHVPYEYIYVYPGIATLIGHPATAFPWGRTRQGSPIGLQAIGPYLEDRTPISFAGQLEREFGGFVAPEGYG